MIKRECSLGSLRESSRSAVGGRRLRRTWRHGNSNDEELLRSSRLFPDESNAVRYQRSGRSNQGKSLDLLPEWTKGAEQSGN